MKKQKIKKGIEKTLIELRNKKGWTRLELLERLSNREMTEKDIKKWESGLAYPDTDMLYELSEIYMVPCEVLITAKSYSYEQAMESFSSLLIRYICYFTGISLEIGYHVIYSILLISLIWSVIYFIQKVDLFMLQYI